MKSTLTAVILIAGLALAMKRAIYGPQKTFARLSVSLVVIGGGGIALAAPESMSVFVAASGLLIGLVLLILMIGIEQWWIFKQLVSSRRNRRSERR